MATHFIPSLEPITDENASLVSEATRDAAYDAHPGAAFVIPVDGGFMAFDTTNDYDRWNKR